jgi:glutaredoxin
MRTLSFIALACLAALSLPAAAQYKWTAPNGVVTYSDLPPPAGTSVSTLSTAKSPDEEVAVPAALRAAVSKYPVVLYTTNECAPCQVARSHLSKRGVPFSERTVRTGADATAFKKLGFTDNEFPALTVGRERSSGFEAGEWDRVLDAAGYPKTAALPPSYRPPPAQSLAGAARRPAPRPASDTAEATEAGDDAAATQRRRPAPVQATAPAPNTPAVRF